MAKKQKNVEGKMVARVYDRKGHSILVRVPVVIDTVPEVPEIIFGKGWAAKLISPGPLAYLKTSYGKAKVL
jgi:hypothetical protein